MKISISLPADVVAALDEYMARAGVLSRSAAIRQAVALLDAADLEDEYAAAWDEWEASGERGAWEATVGDGLNDAAR